MAEGKQYLAAENYEKARIEFSNVLQIDPNDIDGRYLSAVVAEKLHDLRGAFQGYQATLNVDETYAPALAALGRLYVFSGLPQQGLDRADKGLAVHPHDPDLLAVRAAAEVQLGHEQAAFDDATAALAQSPDHEYAVALLAGIYRKRGELDKAATLVEAAIGRRPDSVDLHTVLAQLDLDRGENAQAESELKHLVDLRPKDLEQRQKLVAFYTRTGRLDEAEKALRDLIGLDPKSADYKMALIDFLATRRSLGAAEKALSEQLAKDPKDDSLRLAAGRFYEAHALPAEAERAYEAVIDHAGRNAAGLAARDRLAALRIRSNRIEEARPLIEEVLRESPRDNDALVLRATLALAAHRPADAVTDLRAVLRDRPNSAPVLRTLARAHAENNEPDLARDSFRRAVEADPGNDDIRIEFADYLDSHNADDEARQLIDAVLKNRPQNVKALQIEFRLRLRNGDTKAAREAAEEIVKAEPQSALGYYLEGLLEESAGNRDAAIADFNKALEKRPEAAEPLGALVRVLLAAGREEDARQRLEGVVKQFPEDAPALNLLAQIMLLDNQAEQAAALAQRAIQARPGWWEPYRTKALVMLGQKKQAEAESAYLEGMKATDDSPALGMDLAALYERDGRTDPAIQLYERLHTANPASQAVANNLAMLLATYRNDGVSRQEAQDLVRSFRNSDNPAYLNTYGWVRFQQGQIDEAVTYLRRASSAAPKDPLMHYHLGKALLAAGDAEQARAELEIAVQAKQTFPGKDDAERTLDSLSRKQG